MENQIEQLFSQIENLKEMFEIAYDAAKFNISAQWIMIAALITVGGSVTYHLIKKWFDKAMQDATDNLFDKIEQQEKTINNLQTDITTLINKDIMDKTEFGEWTPYLTEGNHSYSKQKGRFYRLNKLVILWFDLEIEQKDEASEGKVNIGGIPFAFGDFINKNEMNVTGSVFLLNQTKKSEECIQLSGEMKGMTTFIRLTRKEGRLEYSSLKNKSKITGTITHWLQ